MPAAATLTLNWSRADTPGLGDVLQAGVPRSVHAQRLHVALPVPNSPLPNRSEKTTSSTGRRLSFVGKFLAG